MRAARLELGQSRSGPVWPAGDLTARRTESLGTELCAVKVCMHKRQQRGGAQLWLVLLLSAPLCIVLSGCVPHVTTLLWTAP